MMCFMSQDGNGTIDADEFKALIGVDQVLVCLPCMGAREGRHIQARARPVCSRWDCRHGGPRAESCREA